MYDISSQDNYLLVTFRDEVDSLQIISAIKELLSREDYSDTNDIWIFDNRIMDVSYQALEVFAKNLSYI